MAILRSSDWKKLIQLCKAEIQNTKGDKRAARGLLYRLTFYLSENRLVKPQRRMKQEPPIQTVFELDKGTPLSPKEVDLKTKLYDHTVLGPGPYRLTDFGHPDCPVCEEARIGSSVSEPEGPAPEEVSQRADIGGGDKVRLEEGSEEIPGIIDAT